MATDVKTRPNKQSTITFTLPLSCQICLGKVKQPVLCPNHHVFCQLCMDIWLEKNKQCPTCRIDINEENPVRTVIGGQLEEEDKTRMSTAEIRRVRFELLYREYEDQFEQMKKELIILRTENNILAAQLKDAEEENEGHRQAEDKQLSNSSANDGPNLLLLTQNLQEAQKLYAGIKGEMAHLKEENGKLKDENINLTRENETLRLEIAQRSPKKFSRITVATLEAKVSELEKENRQLKNALQRSDVYIEDLEKQITKISDAAKVNPNTNKSISRDHVRASGKMPEKAKVLNSHDFDYGQVPSSSSVKRVLFNNFDQAMSEPSSSHMSVNEQNYLEHNDSEQKVEESIRYHQNASAVNSQKQPESIMKNTTSTSKTSNSGSDLRPAERGFKKVKFDIQGENNVSSSFDLEMPSPYHGSGHADSSNTCEDAGKSVNSTGAKQLELDSESNHNKLFGLKSSFDDYITTLLEKSNTSTYSRPVPDNNLRLPQLKTYNPEQFRPDNVHNIHGLQSQDAGNSSHLSVPDLNSPAGVSVIEQIPTNSQYKTKSEMNDLNISMTPEFSDCLQLMTQAERKLEQMPSERQAYNEQDSSALKSAEEDFTHLSLSKQTHPPTSLPQSMYSSLKPRARTPTSFPTFTPTPDVSWKQQFYSSLQANPYKFNPSIIPLSRSQSLSSVNLNSGISEKPSSLSSNDLVKSTKFSMHIEDQHSSKPPHIPSVRPALKESLHDLDSNSLSVSQPSSNVFHPVFSSSSSNLMSTLTTTNLAGDGASRMTSNSYSLHADSRRSSLSHVKNLFPFPSADVKYQVRPQPPSQPPSSASSLPFSSLYSLPQNTSNSMYPHIEPGSSIPSQSHSHPSSSLAFSNPLPPSLNNSALEWPDESTDLSMPRLNGVGSKAMDNLGNNSSDTLPVPSHLGQKLGSSNVRNGKHNINNSYISSSLMSDENSFQLPEPKKRLFNTSDDDLELPSSPLKTVKR